MRKFDGLMKLSRWLTALLLLTTLRVASVWSAVQAGEAGNAGNADMLNQEWLDTDFALVAVIEEWKI